MHHLPTSSSQCAVHDCAWLGPTYHDAFDGSPRCWPAGSLMQRHAMEQPRQSRHLPCARMTWDRGRPAPGLAIQGSANTLYLHFGTCDARIVLRCNEVRVTHDPGANLCTINNGLRTRVTTPERNNNNTKPPDGRQRQQQQQRRQQICGSLLQRPPAPCANATLTQGSMRQCVRPDAIKRPPAPPWLFRGRTAALALGLAATSPVNQVTMAAPVGLVWSRLRPHGITPTRVCLLTYIRVHAPHAAQSKHTDCIAQ